MLIYTVDENKVVIKEEKDGNDHVFYFHFKDDETFKYYQELKNYFQGNGIICDALFYSFSDGTTQVIVQDNYYIDFIIHMLKYKIVTKVEWT